MRRIITLVILTALPLAACTSSQRKSISETAVRNTVALGAAKEFKDRGYPIQDHMKCTAKASKGNGSHVGVLCTGTTTKGQTVGLTGTTNNDRGDKGDFVGTVNGQQLFQKTCLGC
jgi:hypothetical protein